MIEQGTNYPASKILRYSPHKEAFRFIRKWTVKSIGFDGGERNILHCEYEASFWDGPVEVGQKGRYAIWRILDQVTDQGTFLNTSPTVSYYADLKRACGL